MPDYELVIGLEVHVQLNTEAKIFAPEKNDFGLPPNHDISAVTIAHPGSLPVINKKVIESGVKIGLAVGAEINRQMFFDRKNYFYPDLPKGYQITQDATPICVGGGIEVAKSDGSVSYVSLTKIHLEEDAGKSIHTEYPDCSIVDLNRSGVPLIEMVTDPVIASADEAMIFLKEVRKLVRYLGISDGNMEEGSMRCDANISIRIPGENLGSKVEIKNMNSIRNVGRAINYEFERQSSIKNSKQSIISETRTFDADSGETHAMRVKEALNDYRYFPDPDIAPVVVDDAWFDSIKSTMSRLPHEIKRELMEVYGLPEYDAVFISEDQGIADYYLQAVGETSLYKRVSNWIMGPVKSYLNDQQIDIESFGLTASKLVDIIELVENGKVNYSTASQDLFRFMLENREMEVLEAAEKLNILQDGNSHAIQSLIEEVLKANPQKVKEYQNGKKGLIGMFMGQVMKKAGGKVDPKLANQLIMDSLQK